MSWLCHIVGHKTLEGKYSGGQYMEVRPGAIDGIRREHARLIAECPRCGQEYNAGAIHIPERFAEKEFKRMADSIADRAIKALQEPIFEEARLRAISELRFLKDTK